MKMHFKQHDSSLEILNIAQTEGQLGIYSYSEVKAKVL